jgi:hypothetical protein
VVLVRAVVVAPGDARGAAEVVERDPALREAQRQLFVEAVTFVTWLPERCRTATRTAATVEA